MSTIHCGLSIATHTKNMHNHIIFVVNWRILIVNYSKTTPKNPPVDYQIDLLLYFLTMNRNAQVTT
jgi:hypothetical protein